MPLGFSNDTINTFFKINIFFSGSPTNHKKKEKKNWTGKLKAL